MPGYKHGHTRKPEPDRETKRITETTQKPEAIGLTEQKHKIREKGLKSETRELEESLESKISLEKENDPNGVDGTIPELIGDKEEFDVIAEYGEDVEEDGDFSETHMEDKSFLDRMLQSTGDLSDRISIATRGEMCDLVIEECGKGDFYAYTPGSNIIGGFKHNKAFKSDIKTKWSETIYKTAVEERQIHLQHIGDFLIRQIKTTKDFFKKDSLEDAFSLLEDFTTEKIVSDSTVGIHKSTVGRMRNAIICLPKFGKVSLDRILNITKHAHHYRILYVVRNEDRNNPLSHENITKKAGIKMTAKNVGNILKELHIPTKISKRKEAYRNGTAGWIK